MCKWLLYFLITSVAIANGSVTGQIAQDNLDVAPLCPDPILSRLQEHTVTAGESIQTIAAKYNLTPQSIEQNNPTLNTDTLLEGTILVIPPINGLVVEVPPQATWQDLASAYGVGADLLFEINGCQPLGKQVFIPGVIWQVKDPGAVDNYTGLRGYPLPTDATVGLAYGWQDDKTEGNGLFHSGIDLLAESGTPVLAAEAGQVVFVGQEGNYGNLIVINHSGGRQTRYAHLATIEVKVGQEVNLGERLGTVGTTGLPDLKTPHLHFEVRYRTSMGWIAQDPSIHFQR